MKTRKEFVEYRSAFYSALCLQGRRAWNAAAISTMGSGSLNYANRASESKTANSLCDEMESDYEIMKKISALKAPTQHDFEIAKTICEKWSITP